MTNISQRRIILIAHNLRSCHNVGSLLRTAEGLGIEQVILSGYTPYPAIDGDKRLPHIAQKISKQINKTALGAELMVRWSHQLDIMIALDQLRADNWELAAVEQSAGSVNLPGFIASDKLVLIVGREVEGLEPDVLAAASIVLEIPMSGQKESFNVVQAAAMALYQCRFR
jgi:23S rRNA (guanosine2251-2'-O)-methyltransferase